MTINERTKIKHRDRAASEERLLSAAETCFARFGFNGATTKMIAKKAGVNEALIARYFEGKSGLLFAMIEKSIREEQQIGLNYPAQPNVELELFECFSASLKRALDKPEFFKIVISQALTDPKFLKRLKEIVPMFTENPPLLERLEKLQHAGKIKSDISIQKMVDDIDLYQTGLSFFNGVLLQTPFEECAEKLKEFIRNYVHGCS